jgi:hypothetical protein
VGGVRWHSVESIYSPTRGEFAECSIVEEIEPSLRAVVLANGSDPLLLAINSPVVGTMVQRDEVELVGACQVHGLNTTRK